MFICLYPRYFGGITLKLLAIQFSIRQDRSVSRTLASQFIYEWQSLIARLMELAQTLSYLLFEALIFA